MPSIRRSLATSAATLLALAFLPTAARGTPGVWDDGGTPSANWGTATNWVGDVIPVNGDNLDFSAHAAVANLTVTHNIAALTSIGSITFTSKQFTLAGNALSISGGIFNNSAVTQTVSFGTTGLTLTAAQQFNAQGGALAVTSAVNLNGNLLTVTGAQNTTLSGAVSGGTGITKNGNGILAISGANSYTGTTSLNFGTLSVQNATALGTSTLAVNGGTLDIGTASAIANGLSVGGDFTITVTGGGTGTLSGPINLNGAVRTITNGTSTSFVVLGGVISNGGLTLRSTGVIGTFQTTGAAANTSTGLTTLLDNTSFRLGRTVLNGSVAGDLLIGGTAAATLDASDQIADTATVTVNSNGLTGFQNKGLELHNFNETIGSLLGTGTVGLGSGTLTVGAGNFSGVITDGFFGVGGKLVKNTAGTLTLSGANTYTVTTKAEKGTLLLGASNTLADGHRRDDP